MGNLSQQAGKTLYSWIAVEKRFRPGEKLPNEVELSAQLGVSRAAVHKAAAALTAQGYALEACRAIVKYGFETLELDKIRLCTKRSNTASRILAEKMGFIQVPSSCKDSIVFCMQKGYNSLYTK